MDSTVLIEAQQALEEESRALGIARYRQQRSKWSSILGQGVDEAALPPGRKLLRLALTPTIEAVSHFIKTANSGAAGRRHTAVAYIKDAAPEALAYLTLRSAIQAGAQRLKLQRAAIALASTVADHLAAEAFHASNKAAAAGLERTLQSSKGPSQRRIALARQIRRREGAAPEWSQRTKALIGMKLIELAADATGLFELVRVDEGAGKTRKSFYRLELTSKAAEWLERQHARCELLDPIPMPMVVEPRPWTTPFDGGYLSPPAGNAIIRQQVRPYLDEVANIEMPHVYRAINTIQGTAWRINRPILDAMREIWEGGGTLGDLPLRNNEPLPPKPGGLEHDPAAQVAWRHLAAQVHEANARRKSKRLAFVQKLWVAEKLVDHTAIYFPHSMDWRGRVYPIPAGGPSPQGDDIGKALLTFAEALPLGSGGDRWLAIHLANCFGVDKVSYDDRVRWVHDNEAAILDSAAQPLDGERFWTSADKPWQALAACLEWAGFKREGEAFASSLPIALDGSNSGLQHLTALLRDSAAAPHVNLVDQDQPGDLYAVIAATAQELVNRSSDPKAEPWKGGKVTRAIVKGPCMTYAYSAKRRSMAEQIKGVIDDLDERQSLRGASGYLNGFDSGEASFWLAGLLYELIGRQVPAAKQAMRWLQDVMNLVNKADLPIWWTTPAGLPVLQRYPKAASRTVEATWQGRRVQISLAGEAQRRAIEDSLDGNRGPWNDHVRARSGIAPNFVHSLDAAHLMMVANRCADQGITSLAVIHDSFAAHAGRTSQLADLLRDTFVELYQGNPLAVFREEVLAQLTHQPGLATLVPPLPAFGTLDLESVRHARYMFS